MPQTLVLTKRVIDAAAPHRTDTHLWDAKLRGFGLRVHPSGTKTFILKKRTAGGRQVKLTIGRYGELTVDQARNLATELAGELIRGNDPAADKRQARLNPRFDAFARRYLIEHCEIQNKPSTLRNSRSIVETILIPRFGAKAISEISHDDVLKLRNALRQKPYRANRTIALLRHLMNWAEELGARPRHSNPCPKGTMLPEKKRNRFLAEDELVRLAKVLNAEEKEWRGHLPNFAYRLSVVVAIRLLVLTGARLGEILSLKWEDVDVKQRLIWLKDKTGPKPIFLSEQALAVLRSIPRKKDNLHVIVGQRTGAPLTNLEKPWRRIRKAAGSPMSGCTTCGTPMPPTVS
jgi:integrase